MSNRSIHPFVALVGAAVLSLGLVGGAVAQEEQASPPPGAAAERQAAEQERRAAREERREERRARRDEVRLMRRIERDERRAESAADRDARKAEQAARRAAWAQVRAACETELRAALDEHGDDPAGRRAVMAQTREACSRSYREARAAAAGTAHIDAIDELYTELASDDTGVVRTGLGIAEPGSAPGQELGLWHYRIPARTDLPPHTHPGWQLARVTAGALEYTVIEGESILLRVDGSEPMGPGTYVLETGDGVIENPDLIHAASNRTDEPVTIISATLFPAGADISTLVEEELDEATAEDGATDDEGTAVDEPADG